jgi:hypothetical protein
MKTEDLIKAIAADNASVKTPIKTIVAGAAGAAVLLAAAAFSMLLGIRPDFAHAITHDARFMFKFAFTLSLALPAFLLMRRLSRPDGEPAGIAWLLVLPFLMLAVAVGVELYAVPPEHWSVAALGTMPGACMKYISILSIAPLATVLYALRSGATTHPALAGAAAGLMSAAIGATFYAAFCVDDSPMFVAIWYVAGIAIVTALGTILGARLLRW